ncbi:regulatory protein RecX [Altericroceibacterium xinjiangense]|uniref:regulatory protein RecX n=1 Tax=Altericroceibacterium xinjiangense TaxID=762261 RepID=UPI000F7E9FFF|nr:regulatory protein RecX [Altericroceibacterium xinjiangense]
MERDTRSHGRRKRTPKPLDRARLEELALAYVARFATSASKLERYLVRKLRERGWDGEGEPPVATLVARYVDLGYVDDEGFARAKSGSLLRRGYGVRRIRQSLAEAGISEDIRERIGTNEQGQRQAALALARKRRFGPFGLQPLDRPAREKQIAAMMRAGHPLDSAREMIDAPNVDAAEQWVAEAGEN